MNRAATRAVAFILLWFAEFSLVSGATGIIGEFATGVGTVRAGPVAVSALFVVLAMIHVAVAVGLVNGDGRARWTAAAVGTVGIVAVPFLTQLPLPVILVIAAGYAAVVLLAVWVMRPPDDRATSTTDGLSPMLVLAALLLGVQSAVFVLFLIAGALSGSVGTVIYAVFAVIALAGAAGVLLQTPWGHVVATSAAVGTAGVGILLAFEVPIFGLVILAAALATLVMLLRERISTG